jgi:uncharacterized protein (DUF433 family)
MNIVPKPGVAIMTLPDFLTLDPDGEIRLTGHRIGLFTILRLHFEGHSPGQIAEELPTVTQELIRQVLDFYRQNKAQTDAYFADYQAELDRQASAPLGPGALKVRKLMTLIRQADAQHIGDAEWAKLSQTEKLKRIGQAKPAKTV